jgi:inhibitor of KinA sporulation pathway (predicted exonuclease)
MAEALRQVSLPLVGTHHRGIDDARNIARLLDWLVRRAGVGQVVRLGATEPLAG